MEVGRDYQPCFTEKEAEAQREELTLDPGLVSRSLTTGLQVVMKEVAVAQNLG